MRDFQWVVTDFLLRHLRGELSALLALLFLILIITGVLVGIELRKNRVDDHADQ